VVVGYWQMLAQAERQIRRQGQASARASKGKQGENLGETSKGKGLQAGTQAGMAGRLRFSRQGQGHKKARPDKGRAKGCLFYWLLCGMAKPLFFVRRKHCQRGPCQKGLPLG